MQIVTRLVLAASVLSATAGLLASTVVADGAAVTIFVPRTVIYPGDLIAEINLVELKIVSNAQTVVPFGSRKDDLVGKVARRTLVSGQPVPVSAVRKKEAVVQGRSYDIVYQSGFLTVMGTAVPLQSGAAGETVNVRNPETGVVVKAVVQASGTLVVSGQ